MLNRIVAAVRGNLVAWLALFVAMGGTSLAASHYMINSTRQINPRVIKKLKGNHGARGLTGPTGPTGATGPRGTPNPANFFTKTESDGRFLGKSAAATDSSKLGGTAASGYLHGTGKMVSGRIAVAVGASASLLELDFAHIVAVCNAGAVPVMRFEAELAIQNLVASSTNFNAAPEIATSNALGAGDFFEAPHTVTTPQSVTWQASYFDGTNEQVATAWTTGQDEGGTCVFTGQGLTTL
jgi:hypothetical protein